MFPLITQHRTSQASAVLPLTSLCALLGVSRATYYRQPAEPETSKMELRDAIQRIALAWPTDGYRRITAELQRQGACG
jgi:transposase InsO family protein